MNMMLVKRMIKELLIMQNQIIWEGGYHQQSEVFCLFQSKTEHILHLFNLPYNDDMVAQVFEYPLSPAFEFKDQCNADCPRMAEKMMRAYMDAVESGTMQPYRRYPQLWLLNERVTFVFNNLLSISEDSGKEID